MKKVVCFLLVLMLVFTLTACGNENWGFGNYTYTHVHISDGNAGYCATVDSWHDNEIGCELHTIEFGDMYCSEGTYFLFEKASKCPYCNNGE